MSKHTEAPWFVHEQSSIASTYWDVQTADGQCVAEIVHSEAGARLIAAAPKLVEALRALEVSANTTSYCYDRMPGNFAVALEELKAAAENARAALAAAEA